jgi:ParB family chromosome partitioning protein
MEIKHRVKILPEHFTDLLLSKDFELRKDDRDYKEDDNILFLEWDGEKYTGNGIFSNIKFILRNVPQFGLDEGFCILGLGTKLWIENAENFRLQWTKVNGGTNE